MGHCLAAAGSLECVGTVLQFEEKEIFANVNCEDLHADIVSIVDPTQIPRQPIALSPKIIAKASFGFGDVNACIIFKAFNS